MRKSSFSFFIVLLVGGFLWWSGVFSSATKGVLFSPSGEKSNSEVDVSAHGKDSLQTASASPAKPLAETGVGANPPEIQSSGANLLPKRFFPESPVVSVLESSTANGEILVVKTVETKREQPFVRIEETYRIGAGGQRELVDQVAMVSNQLLVDRPEAISEKDFFSLLQTAGAQSMKKTGLAYLITFPAEPSNPKALESFREKVLAVSGGAIVVEPNYIRRIFLTRSL
jgi:hypothetical protein